VIVQTGLLTTLRFLFAQVGVTECYRDISPITNDYGPHL
jgi:hypothetical protein